MFVLGAIIIIVAGTCRAQEADEANAQSAPTNAATASPGETNELDVLRDPFWPVGYEPAPPEVISEGDEDIPPEKALENVIDWPALQLRGLTRATDGSYLALIHGLGWVEKGDTVKCVNKKIMYKWLISDVGEGGVRCDRVAAIPLSQLNKKKAEGSGLSPPSEQSE